ncbi:hypothetical protein V5O48_011519 [Marasmius crinis-equi]|uniref:Uncharacterized protein n=1 Tax=Marasmius crinis-equi TaxID=585013 RepID=A0ABR3F5R5_9AGAR
MTQAYTTNGLSNMYFRGEILSLDAISFGKMQQLEASTQINLGLHSWQIDKSYATWFDTDILYSSQQRASDDARAVEKFVAANVGNATVNDLPGLQLNVSCSPASSLSLDTDNLNASWPSFCQSHIPQFSGLTPAGRTGGTKNSSQFSLYLCNNKTTAFPFTEENQTQSRNMGYLYYSYTSSVWDNKTQETNRTIQCNSTLTTGTTTGDGLMHWYLEFSPQRLLNGSSAKEPLLDPLFAVFSSLGRSEVDLNLDDLLFQYGSYGSGQTFADIVSMSVVENLHDAATILTTAMARLSREDAFYRARVPVLVTVFSRNDSYAAGTYVLLGLWGVLIATITARSWRRSFSNSLNSYVAAELVFRERHLLEGVPIGEADENKVLRRARFVFPSGEMDDVEILKKKEVCLSGKAFVEGCGARGGEPRATMTRKGRNRRSA